MITVIFIILYGVIGTFIILGYEEDRDVYFDSAYNELAIQLESKINQYKDFSQYYYEDLVNDESILFRYNQAVNGDETVEDTVRDELYNYYLSDFNTMQDYNVDQFSFFLPDGTLFLQMHDPNIYGMVSERYSVNYVNQEHVPISGFEMGDTSNQYHYLYPLSYQGEHIGTVDISVSITESLQELTNRYDDKDYLVIVEKHRIDNTIDSDVFDYYTMSFSDGYYIERDHFNETDFNVLPNQLFNQLLGDVADETLNLSNYSEKYITAYYEGSNYAFVFIPITNMENQNIGYLISGYSGDTFMELRGRYLVYGIGATLFIWSTFVFVLFIDQGRRKLKLLSQKDPLTGSYNRRYLDRFLQTEMARSKRTGHPFSLLMLDIDHFKKVNDLHGHLKGDKVLENLVVTINRHIREEDIIARFGGEEFVIVLINTGKDKAHHKAEQLKHLIENSNVADLNITISIGVTEYTEGATIDSLIHEADKALYYAKETGRNRAILYDMEMEE